MSMLSENELIEYVKPILKAQGFLKKRKRWTRTTECFTYYFYIQGSCFDKNVYYVRPGIKVNNIHPDVDYAYDHFFIDIPITTKEEILHQAEVFFSRWTSIDYLKSKVAEFIEWEKRNPVEKRRAGLMDDINDPVPAEELFTFLGNTKELILNL